MSTLANAFAFISMSTSAYTCVVSRETWPSHARMVLMSTPERSRWTAVVCRLFRPRNRRHSMAMGLLQAGVDRAVIALWLGHESVDTTQIYLEANLAMKEEILA